MTNVITASEFTALQLKRLSEKAFRQHVVDYARAHNWLVYWTWNSKHSPSGWVDLVLIRPPRILFWELKREKNGRITKAQSQCLGDLRACGLPARVVKPSDMDWIEETLQ